MNCDFCDGPLSGNMCAACGRNNDVPKIICGTCKMKTPKSEGVCCRCGTKRINALSWKIPVIVGMFLLAVILSIILNSI